ncbi:MAG: hypothetical protein WC488_04535 [Candidatus Micrarchaeia archaeon]
MTRMRVCTIGWQPGIAPDKRLVGVRDPKVDPRNIHAEIKRFVLPEKPAGKYRLELGDVIDIPPNAKEFKGKP